MSANGAFSSTLDYSIIGGGVVSVKGPLSVQINPSISLEGRVPIYGEIQPFTLDLTIVSGIETPTIYAEAPNLSFGFTQYSTIEFGVQKWLESTNNSIEFTANSAGFLPVAGNADILFEFLSSTNIYVFSEGPVSVETSFSLASKARNVSTHYYTRVGENYVRFDSESNGVKILDNSNGIRIADNGIREADIIQN